MSYDKYFDEKHYVSPNNDHSEFDVLLREQSCSSFQKNQEVCDTCFNRALVSKMREFNSLQRLNFINYQLEKYSDGLDWLERLYAFLKDNQSEFPPYQLDMYNEYLQIARVGIKQISDRRSGFKKKSEPSFDFVNESRIEDLQDIKSADFDLSKLIALCKELNGCYTNECYLSVAMLIRAIIDHIPPIFGKQSFQDVHGQYGTRSFKEHMQHLDKSSRKIADSYLHSHIRSKETLPNNTQVNFSQDIDVLLAEVCRILT